MRLAFLHHGFLIALLAAGLAGAPAAQEAKIPGVTFSWSEPAYTDEEILDAVGDMFGPGARAGMEAMGVAFKEIASPFQCAGAHVLPEEGQPVIALDTRYNQGGVFMTLSQTALVAYHEFKHLQNAATFSESQDPTTKGEDGPCAHANMHAEDILDALQWDCPMVHEPSFHDVAEAIGEAMGNMNYYLLLCVAGGGSIPPYVADAQDIVADCLGG